MTEEPGHGRIDDEVQEFLRERIESFEQLEILLFLHRRGHATVSAPQMAEVFNIQVSAAESALDRLARSGLLEIRAGDPTPFSYTSDPRFGNIMDRLTRAYEESRVEVLRLMSAHAIERVRTHALRLFGDAFILRKKKDG